MKRKMRLVDNSGSYQYTTTLNKVYEVEKVEGIFETRPFYQFINDEGKETACHLYRFEEIKEESQNEVTN